MQFKGQRPKHKRQSHEAMLWGFKNTGLKEGIWEPSDAIYDIIVMLWRYFHENN